MKIYIDLAKQAITNTTDEKVYEGDFYSNVFEVLFYNYEDTNWFPTMSQLAPNGREAGDFTADALGVGENHTYVEDGKTYLRFTFTMGATWVLMKGRSNFYIWLNRLNGTVLKKCVGMVTVMIDQSTTYYFIADPLFNPAVKTYIDACVAEIGDGSPKYFDTAANIALLTEDKGLAVATDTGHLYYWNSTSTSATKYTDSGLVYNDLSAYYTKNESDNRYAQLGADNIFTGDNDFRGDSLFSDDINQASGDFSSQGNVEAHSFTKQGTNLDDIYASKSDTYTKDETDTLLNDKADKTNTYTKSEVNTALNLKADKSTTYTKTETNALLNGKADNNTTYTKTETDNLLSAKADKTTVNGIDNRVGALENEITDLQSVQNVVDVVATKSALNSYDTSKLEENDKIQVIADETHGGASTVYNWNGSVWQYVGAYGGNSYTKTQTDALLDLKADNNTTYTKTETNTLLNGKVNTSDFDTLDGRVDDIEDDINTLKSVQNVVDIVATYSALQSYDTSYLGINDKIQVIADETHGGASTIYNWSGSVWEYVGAYGGNSYTKTQTDALLDLKADKSDTYTKTQVDNKLDLKADKSTTYTKTEIDTILNTVLIEKSFESLAVDQLTITGYVTQEILNSIGARTQVKLRIYDSSNDLTFILAPNMTPENNFYNYKCTFNSPIDADGMIEIQGCISSDREYSFVLKNIKVYTEAEVNTALNGKMNKANPTGTGSISMNSGTASGTNSYANGSGTTASGTFSRAIGFGAQASGSYSMAVQGNASGTGAIAIGNMANASGDNSKALGDGTKAKGDNQTVTGQFNIPDTSSLEIIGNGAYMNTSNARLLDANGNEYLKGDIYVNSTFTKDANGDLDTKSGTKLVAVSANPTLAGTESALTGLEVDGVKYAVPQGGSGGGGSESHLYEHNLRMTKTNDSNFILYITLYLNNSNPITVSNISTILGSKTYGINGNSGYGKIGITIKAWGADTCQIKSFSYSDNAIATDNQLYSSITFTDTVTQIL